MDVRAHHVCANDANGYGRERDDRENSQLHVHVSPPLAHFHGYARTIHAYHDDVPLHVLPHGCASNYGVLQQSRHYAAHS